ncbi:hypothetical protein MVEG_11117 [Podila verticillata NRRL 6337]|uniref:DUF4419 domain-containing protein n=1 Tax=Podila verticillata NRRL 6337 TaxID=1069443 RepID=A0A086TMA3_9FUNG|nr:hypothetical protein MVEG_11117 [Podila verticillata NRRL 6337]
MPITINPCGKPLEAIDTRYSTPKPDDHYVKNPFDIVPGRFEEQGEVFQCSFPMPSKESFEEGLIMPSRHVNGFVDSALKAYNEHHHLVIRPDDVWIAILSQFNFFVNANAEKLRHLFVAHEGKKDLKIRALGTRYTVDFGNMATQMGKLIQEHVIDPNLRKWIKPDFTTTTADDETISSVIMMSTLKKYFSYSFACVMCGLPAVTLLGEKGDWEKLLDRIEKLPEYGAETTQWHSLLKPVIAGFIETFNNPNAAETKDFWQKITHQSSGGSGPTYLSGWITAFCFFNSQGVSLYNGASGLKLGGSTFHRIDINRIPPAYADVPVLLDDNGLELKTVMVAGLVGIRVSGTNTIQPQPAWWIAEDMPKELGA